MDAPIRAAISDSFITFTWITCYAVTTIITKQLGFSDTDGSVESFTVATSRMFLLIVVFDAFETALGGATYNPTTTVAFYTAGEGNDNLYSMAIRVPAQAAGAAGGALLLTKMMPAEYMDMIGSPTDLNVDTHTGAIAEGVLTFFYTFAVLCIIVLRRPRNPYFRTLLFSICSEVAAILGNSYTGPSMNPATAFGWAYVNNRHNTHTWELLYVYWIGPFVGAILAALLFRAIQRIQIRQ